MGKIRIVDAKCYTWGVLIPGPVLVQASALLPYPPPRKRVTLHTFTHLGLGSDAPFVFDNLADFAFYCVIRVWKRLKLPLIWGMLKPCAVVWLELPLASGIWPQFGHCTCISTVGHLHPCPHAPAFMALWELNLSALVCRWLCKSPSPRLPCMFHGCLALPSASMCCRLLVLFNPFVAPVPY